MGHLEVLAMTNEKPLIKEKVFFSSLKSPIHFYFANFIAKFSNSWEFLNYISIS
jgi:hypothetical protein